MSMNTSSSAMGISESGIIVGTGVFEGDIQAYALVPDGAVAALLQEFTARGTEDGIEIRWGLSLPDDGLGVSLERAPTESGPWQTVDVMTGPGATMLDGAVEPGRTYFYRLRIADSSGETYVLGLASAERTDIGALGVVLGAPSPNPTRLTTSAAYRLPVQQSVRITVHDVRGRLVRTIVDGVMGYGEHVMRWDGRSEDGLRAPTGMYFINMQTAQASRVQRVVLVR
jgi:hypothetical protein